MVAFVFDLARRLAQLNEREDDPAATGEGIVLIDEIDLHLHPAWQRRIANDLVRVFPKLHLSLPPIHPRSLVRLNLGV